MPDLEQPIHFTELLSRCVGDADFVREILGVFHQQAISHLSQLRSRVADNDLPGTKHVAHAMKGSAASLGAETLRNLCGQLEQSTDGGSLNGAGEHVAAIVAELDRVVAYFPTIHEKLESN